LNFVLEQFAAVERSNSRVRELEADKVAYNTYGAQEFARSLTKVVLLAPALAELGATDLEEGETIDPKVALTALLGDEKFREVEAAATQRQSHPFDTHPTLAERLEPLQLDVAGVIAEVTAQPPFQA
jgi:Zn-dependent protease with chaperone function